MKQHLYLILFLISMIFSNAAISLSGLGGFKCYGITNIKTPIRISSHNSIECFSLDGKRCISNISSDDECREIVNKNIENLKAVRCTNSDKRSWCILAKNFFHNKWHCPSETGDHISSRINIKTGMSECLSLDGKKCITGKFSERLCVKSQSCIKTKKSIKPLKCGNRCKRSFAFFFFTGRWLCKKDTNINKVIRLGIDGNIECAGNKNKCFDVNLTRNCVKMIRNSKNLLQIKCDNSNWCQKAKSLFFENKTFTLLLG